MWARICRGMNLAKDRGASAVEYGLMVAAIAAVIVAVVFGLGGVVRDVFGRTCNGVASAAQDANPEGHVGNQDCGPAGAEDPDPDPAGG